MDEIENIRDRYNKRSSQNYGDRYSIFNPSVYMSSQERERALLSVLCAHMRKPVNSARVLEIGCGSGGNLTQLLKFGFSPENIVGNELLEDRIVFARALLPKSVILKKGDACELDYTSDSFDIVYQSTVFTSILDENVKIKLANKMWDLLQPGGGILWYDFVYDNPNNKDVKGIKISEIKKLFPLCKTLKIERVTLAPPISRAVCKIHHSMYTYFNLLPFLRTHVLCWIEKPL